MQPSIHAYMSKQHGLVTRRQAIEAGSSADTIDRWVRSGRWVIIRRGVYAERELADAASSYRERRILADRAASLRIGAPHVMSHESAALLLDVPILRTRHSITHVTRPGVVGSHLRHGVKHHLAPYAPTQVTDASGARTLNHVRTALDIAREHGSAAGVVAVDGALRHGHSRSELWTASVPMKYWPHVRTVREAIELGDGGSDSIGETLTRLLVLEMGRGRPQTQFGLTADGRTAWVDLRLGRHLIEFDGRAKYQRLDEGGWALAPADEVLWREKKRQDWLQGFKLGMSRVTWSELFGSARQVTLHRIERELLETCRLFGSDIDDLTPFLARGPRPRPISRAA